MIDYSFYDFWQQLMGDLNLFKNESEWIKDQINKEKGTL